MQLTSWRLVERKLRASKLTYVTKDPPLGLGIGGQRLKEAARSATTTPPRQTWKTKGQTDRDEVTNSPRGEVSCWGMVPTQRGWPESNHWKLVQGSEDVRRKVLPLVGWLGVFSAVQRTLFFSSSSFSTVWPELEVRISQAQSG